jgi:hypothetical protein
MRVIFHIHRFLVLKVEKLLFKISYKIVKLGGLTHSNLIDKRLLYELGDQGENL